MNNDTSKRDDLLLSPDEQKRLQAIVHENGAAAVSQTIGLSIYTIMRAAAGMPVRYASAEVLRQALAE